MDKYLDLLVLFGFLAGLMWAMMKFMLRDIHKDLIDIKTAQARSDLRIDHLYEENNRLYKTLIDMIQKK